MGRLEVPEQNVVVESGGVFRREGVDILLGEKEVAEIEGLEVAGEEFARNLVVQRVMRVVALLEEASGRRGRSARNPTLPKTGCTPSATTSKPGRSAIDRRRKFFIDSEKSSQKTI